LTSNHWQKALLTYLAFLDLYSVLLLQFGNTPVKLATERGNIGAVRLLLKKKADITLADNVSTNIIT